MKHKVNEKPRKIDGQRLDEAIILIQMRFFFSVLFHIVSNSVHWLIWLIRMHIYILCKYVRLILADKSAINTINKQINATK